MLGLSESKINSVYACVCLLLGMPVLLVPLFLAYFHSHPPSIDLFLIGAELLHLGKHKELMVSLCSLVYM